MGSHPDFSPPTKGVTKWHQLECLLDRKELGFKWSGIGIGHGSFLETHFELDNFVPSFHPGSISREEPERFFSRGEQVFGHQAFPNEVDFCPCVNKDFDPRDG